MKVWGIIATILLVLSLIGNLWLYQNLSSLSEELRGLSNEVCDLAFDLKESLMGEQLSHPGWYPASLSEAIDDISNDIAGVSLMRQNLQKTAKENNQLKGENYQLKGENERLRKENEAFKAYIRQIQDEAEQAEKYNIWESLLKLIFSALL